MSEAGLDAAAEVSTETNVALPNSWLRVGATTAAALCVAIVGILIVRQHAASRPFDLKDYSLQASTMVEDFFAAHHVPQSSIYVSPPELRRGSNAHFYFFEYEVELPESLNVEGVESLLTRRLESSDVTVTDLIEDGRRSGLELALGEIVFANIRLEKAMPSRMALSRVETVPVEEAPVSGDVIRPAAVETPVPLEAPPAIEESVLEPEPVAPSTPETSLAVAPERARLWAPPTRTTLFPDSEGDEVATSIAANGSGAPRLAIIVDDGGYGGEATETILSLDPVLTLSILPNTPFGTDLAKIAAERGFEIMLHMPMENMDSAMQHEGQLTVGMSGQEINALTADALAQVPGAVGINNHTGSKFTADPLAMSLFIHSIEDMPLYFIDSRTTADTQAYDVARLFGMRAGHSQLFLDHDNDPEQIERRIDEVIEMTLRQGEMITICHFRPNTARALIAGLDRIRARGIRLVPVSELIQ